MQIVGQDAHLCQAPNAVGALSTCRAHTVQSRWTVTHQAFKLTMGTHVSHASAWWQVTAHAQETSLLAGLIAADSFDAQLDAVAEACPHGTDGLEWDERTHQVLSKAAQLMRLGTSAAESSAPRDEAPESQASQQHCAMSALQGVEVVLVHDSQQPFSMKVRTPALQLRPFVVCMRQSAFVCAKAAVTSWTLQRQTC